MKPIEDRMNQVRQGALAAEFQLRNVHEDLNHLAHVLHVRRLNIERNLDDVISMNEEKIDASIETAINALTIARKQFRGDSNDS